jgi:hypothetical protein
MLTYNQGSELILVGNHSLPTSPTLIVASLRGYN